MALSFGVKNAAEVGFRWVRTFSQHLDIYAIERNLRLAGVGNAKEIPTYTTLDELRTLYYLARNCPQEAIVLEIGSYLGASTCYLAAGVAKVQGKVICVDTWQNETMIEGPRDTFAQFLKNVEGVKEFIVPVRKYSQALEYDDIGGPVSLVFIDGDHSFEAVKADFDLVVPWIKKNGIIAFHDSMWHEGVRQTIGYALSTGKWAVAGSISNLCWLIPAPNS